jgi:hypothetical protein
MPGSILDGLAEARRLGFALDGAPLRLHLGCGERRLDGYVNVDLPPSEHNLMHAAPDLACDLLALRFPEVSVDEIRLHHAFEHFGRVPALGLLLRWHAWLRVGGLLRIETPDLAGSARAIASRVPLRQKLAAARHLAGDQAAPWAFHVDLWFGERFIHTLGRLGFDVRIEERAWPGPPHLANVEALATKRIHLTPRELLVAADELLWESTVDPVERPTWEVWRAQLRALLDGVPAPRPLGVPGQPDVVPPPRPTVAGVVFSRDRPLQLEALLRSFLLHCCDREAVQLRVLYAATSARHVALYEALAEEYPSVTFVRERDFRGDFLAALGDVPYVLLLVDDTLFVADFSLTEVTTALEERSEALGFSLRLGRNTTYVYTLDRPQPMPPFAETSPGVLELDWRAATFAFGYPLEVSSSLYRAGDLRPIVERLAFTNPNTLEVELDRAARADSTLRGRLLCFERSVAFSAPLNVVQQVFPNRASGRVEYTAEALADAFAAGDRIDVTAYAGLVPDACHVEVELAWRRGERPPVELPPPPPEPTEPIAAAPPLRLSGADWGARRVGRGVVAALAPVAPRLGEAALRAARLGVRALRRIAWR